MNVKAKQYVDCACTKIQQDEHCIVGYPSLLCEICGGKGVVPYVKLDGPELWEIVFGIANEVVHEISDEQYTKIAEAINSVFIDTAPSPRAQALEEAAQWHETEAEYYEARNGDKDGVPFPIVAGWHRLHAERIRALSSHPATDASSDLEHFWRPISDADKSITFKQDFDLGDGEKMTIRNSDEYWVRDEDGRVYRAVWSDQRDGYWWDIEGESPVDPVEYMPHPLSTPASLGASA